MDRKWSCPILIKIRQKRTEITAVQSKKWLERDKKLQNHQRRKNNRKQSNLCDQKGSDTIFVKATPFI